MTLIWNTYAHALMRYLQVMIAIGVALNGSVIARARENNVAVVLVLPPSLVQIDCEFYTSRRAFHRPEIVWAAG